MTLKKNFIGIFHSNFINRFISFHDMISKSGAQYPFVIMNADGSDKKGTHWWSFSIYILKKKSFYLIVLASKVSRNSSSKMTKRSSIRYFTVLKSLIKETIKLLY